MFTVALVGSDGSGKTTIARSLAGSSLLPMKYMYMGISPISANVALPTTRLVGLLRVRAHKREVARSDKGPASTHDLHHDHSVKRGPIWVAARTLNRLVDFMYRQLVSWRFQRQGYVVVYDRHLLFDTAAATSTRLGRLQHWLLSNAYPQPDLVIFLDAPAEVLYERKGEATLEYLEGRRRVILEQGRKTPHFVRVDASQSFEQVLAEVSLYIVEFHASMHPDHRAEAAKPALMDEPGGPYRRLRN